MHLGCRINGLRISFTLSINIVVNASVTGVHRLLLVRLDGIYCT